MSRPPLFTNPSELEALADEYFNQCEANNKRPTINGLSLALGMHRDTLYEYRRKDGFSDTLKLVMARLEDAWEQGLAGANATGTIFWLKNQGWSDKTEQEISGKGGGPIETVSRVERLIVRPQHSDG
jgi:hypothetical protein